MDVWSVGVDVLAVRDYSFLGMADTGFSGFAIISLTHLKKYLGGNNQEFEICNLEACPTQKFQFGRGAPLTASHTVDLDFANKFAVTVCVLTSHDSAIPLLLGMRFLKSTRAMIDCVSETFSFSTFQIPIRFTVSDFATARDFSYAVEAVSQEEMQILGQAYTLNRPGASAKSTPSMQFDVGVPDELKSSLSTRYPNFKKLFNCTSQQLWSMHLSRHSPTNVLTKVVADMLGHPAIFDAEVKQFLKLISSGFERVHKMCEKCAAGGRRATFPGLFDVRSVLKWLDRAAADYIVHGQHSWLVLVDYHTGLVFLVLQLERPSTDSFYADILQFGSVFGMPRVLTIDRDGIFMGCSSRVEGLGVRITYRAGESHAQSGRIERINLILREIFKKSGDFLASASHCEVRIFTSTIMNQLNNEQSRNSSSASMRALGFSSLISANALSDCQNSAFSNDMTRQRAQETYNQVISDATVRKFLATKHTNDTRIFSPGDPVFYFRPSYQGKTHIERHSGTILCFEKSSGNFLVLALNGAVLSCSPRDINPRFEESFESEQFSRESAMFSSCKPCTLQGAADGEQTLKISQPSVDEAIDEGENVELVKDRFQEKIKGACLDNFWTVYSAMVEDAEEGHALPPKAPIELCFSDDDRLLCDYGMSVEQLNKYSLQWDDLDETEKEIAYKKSVKPFYDHGVWRKGAKDQIDAKELDKIKRQRKVVVLDSCWVKKAKISAGRIIGKVRIAIRGFKDKISDFAQTDSPTISDISSKLVENFGLSEKIFLSESCVKKLFALFGDKVSWLKIIDAKLVEKHMKPEDEEPQGPRLVQIITAGTVTWYESFWSAELDFSDAFFLASDKEAAALEETWLKMPLELTGNRVKYIRMYKEAPGMKGASRSWYNTLDDLLTEYGFIRSKLDKALYFLFEGEQLVLVLPLHVDDSRIYGKFETVRNFISFLRETKKLPITFRFNNDGQASDFNGAEWVTGFDPTTGRRWSKQSQEKYIAEKLVKIELPKKGSLDLSEKHAKDSQMFKKYEQGIGCLIWAVSKTQKQHSFSASHLASRKTDLTTADIVAFNTVVDDIQQNPISPRLVQLSGGFKIVGIFDGSELSNSTKRGQIGRVVGLASSVAPGLACDFNAVICRSQKAPRVTHASFDVECIAGIATLDDVVLLRAQVSEFQNPRAFLKYIEKRGFAHWFEQTPTCEPELHTDSMGLTRAVRSTLPIKNNRRREDVGDLRESIELGSIFDIFHISGATNPTDQLTKIMSKISEVSKNNFLEIFKMNWYVPDFLK